MTKRTNQTKTTIYRRHAGKCPIKDQPLNTANCECPLWIHGKIRGKFIRESLDTRTIATAERKRRDLENGRSEDDSGPGGPHLVGAASKPKGDVTLEFGAVEFAKTYADLASGTQELYGRAVRDFREWAESKNLQALRDIESEHIRQFMAERANVWGRKTRDNRLFLLSVFLNFCAAPPRRWIPFAPTKDTSLRPRGKKAKAADNDVRQPFSPSQVTDLLAACERMPEDVRDRARALVYLMLFTGLRISDATFAERSYLLPNNFFEYFVIKTGKMIDLPPELQPVAVEALAKRLASRVYFFHPDQDGDYADARRALRYGEGEFSLLMPRYRERVQAARYLVLQTVKLAGIVGAGCHTFRDTFAISLLSNGADVYSVSKALGHSDVKITDRHYLKLVPGYRERMSQCTRVLNYQFPKAG